MEQVNQMPVIGWVALAAFAIFIGYRVYKSRKNKTSGGGGFGGGGGGQDTHRH